MRLPTLAFLLALSPLAAAAQGLVVADNSEGYLNLRGGPGTQHAVLDRMQPGTRVAVLETMGKWARVRTPGGVQGWASLDYLDREEVGAPTLTVAPGTGWLNLRAAPGTDAAILRRMYPGDRVEALAREGEWLRIRHVSGAVGWAHGDYVTD
ncbi:SH3 domain-containing protein [Jannaschia seohaensis]|uniref:N-acetylmuramoyl-L-alanine amidase n=1 Tax=Jannaschia seohaensis TaxID=475081 RepID=A0A2Y9AJB5_9RHOB|nr:SH3 domain-containing protein [Jannaschia seohaensis]PWJ20350.1 N-acetylmuramoyl-L-alanine amidase [Jannaschia seohaensis]SSA44400.1 N-acetylmuramoyl-L-alanine amidase [Jannaschia seohaensis]